MIGFITFLTNTDPNFPSWEYTFCGNRSQEVFHPWFKLKTARYFEQWRRYHGGQEALPAEGQVPQ